MTLLLISDDELEETDTLTCLGCGFEQEVPIEWDLGDSGKNIICSTCWLEDRWDQDKAKQESAAQKPSQPKVAKKGQLSLFDNDDD